MIVFIEEQWYRNAPCRGHLYIRKCDQKTVILIFNHGVGSEVKTSYFWVLVIVWLLLLCDSTGASWLDRERVHSLENSLKSWCGAYIGMALTGLAGKWSNTGARQDVYMLLLERWGSYSLTLSCMIKWLGCMYWLLSCIFIQQNCNFYLFFTPQGAMRESPAPSISFSFCPATRSTSSIVCQTN